METLEELRAIRDGAVEGDLFYDGRYLNKKLHVRSRIDKYCITGKESYIVYSAPLYVNTDKLRALSDIEFIINQMEVEEDLRQSLKAMNLHCISLRDIT